MEPINKEKERVITGNTLREISDAILSLLTEKEWDPAEIIQKLSEKYDPWLIREAIWDLTANDGAQLTWERKLRLGKHSGREIAA